jgi:hypothetical protein
VTVVSEVTHGATRVAAEAVTVVSLEGNAPAPPAAQKTLNRVVATVETPKKKAPGMLYAVAVVIAVLIAGGWMLWRNRPTPPIQTQQPPLKASVTVPVVAQGRIEVNAFPWAKITNVKNLENGTTVDIGGENVTPQSLDLAPGRYEVTLSNPNFPETISRTVDVASGGDASVYVTFSDPAIAKVPDFGVAQ